MLAIKFWYIELFFYYNFTDVFSQKMSNHITNFKYLFKF